jgi:hypothetical protein
VTTLGHLIFIRKINMGLARRIADYAKGIFTDSSGNVGIGTTSPSGFRLNVTGGRSSFNSADDYAIRVGKNGTYGGYIGSNAADVINFYDSSGNEGFRQNNTTLQINNGYGSIATFYGCRAWVTFNGTGTVAIRASGNVSSITDNSVGDYTVNFATAMPDSNYSVGGSVVGNSAFYGVLTSNTVAPTTGSVQVRTHHLDNFAGDMNYVHVQVFR